MKELTIEEKAKRYDEALKRAKDNYKAADTANINVNSFKNTLIAIFPQLKESDDEEIRKWLIEMVEELRKANPSNAEHNGICSDAIAWLEKQSKENMNEALQLEYEKGKADALQEQRKEWTAKDLLNRNEIADILQEYNRGDLIDWLEKQGTKSQGNSVVEAWKDMRLEVYQQASGNRYEPNYSDDTTKMFSLNDIDEIIEKISEQKLFDYENANIQQKDFVQKQELSEKDERLFDLLHTCVCHSVVDPSWEYKKDSKDILSFIERLKSLKERNTWKPSDEQILALQRCIEYLDDSDNEDQGIMESLYNDLRKR